MKKFLIVLLVSFLIPLSACGEKEPIKIGYSNVLTTSQRSLGIEGMYGAQLAVKEINENGGINGRPLQLIIKDDEGNPEAAVAADEYLINKGVVAIIGHGLSSLADDVISHANESNILVISPTISTSTVSDIDDNFFRIISVLEQQGTILANMMLEHNPGESIILYEESNSSFSLGVAQAYNVESTKNSYPIAESDMIPFTSGDNESYADVAEYLNNTYIENVLIVGSSFDVASIMQQVDTSPTLFLPIWAATGDLIELTGPKIEGSYVVNYFDFNNTSTKYLMFRERYMNEYGKEPTFSSMFSYEAVYYLAEALKNTSTYTTSEIKEALLDVQDFKGLMDTYQFNEYGDIERKLYEMVIEELEYEVINNE